jgi:sporulation protein YlmC with PRC-barrel domain
MFTGQEARALIGATAYDHRGQEIGEVTRVYFRQASGEPEWLAVKTTGLAGSRETFAPLGPRTGAGPA